MRCLRVILPPLSLLLLTLLLRLPALAQPLYTDEGIYAAEAQFFWAWFNGSFVGNSLLPPQGMLNLYPLISSWLFAFSGPVIVGLRLWDALWMGLAVTILWYALRRFSAQTGVAWWACLFFVLLWNQPAFIDAGFKNAITLGMLFLFAALACMQQKGAWASWVSGSCLAMAVLFREPMVVPALLLFLYGVYRQPRARCLAVLGGGVGTVAVVLLLLALARGGLDQLAVLWSFYWHLAAIYQGARLSVLEVWQQSWLWIRWFAPWLFLVGGWAVCYRQRLTRQDKALMLLGVALMLSGLPEILAKQPFRYHLGQGLIGVPLLFAPILRHVLPEWRRWSVFLPGLVVLLTSLWLAGNNMRMMQGSWKLSQRYAPVMLYGQWDNRWVYSSFYLASAAVIRRYTQPDDRILVSGFHAGLYPLSRRLPQDVNLTDLSRAVMYGLPAARRQALLQHPPRLFLATERHFGVAVDRPFAALTQALAQHYPEQRYVPRGLPVYGGFSARIYFR